MQIPNIDVEKLVKYLLNQSWHAECKIIPDYMPPYPSKGTRPTVVVMFPNQFENVFLRYSCGPAQGFFWDIYGDDMQCVELAILALSQAPVPLNFRRLESHVEFKIPLKKKDAPLDTNEAGEQRRFMNFQQAFKVFTKELRRDKSLYLVYQANIAMAYFDCAHWEGSRDSFKKRHTIGNRAADHFLKLLLTPVRPQKKRSRLARRKK